MYCSGTVRNAIFNNTLASTLCLNMHFIFILQHSSLLCLFLCGVKISPLFVNNFCSRNQN